MAHEEYLRRNLAHASAVGARASAEKALKRLAGMKRPPKWLVEALVGISGRVGHLTPHLVEWRNSAPDAPDARPQGKDSA